MSELDHFTIKQGVATPAKRPVMYFTRRTGGLQLGVVNRGDTVLEVTFEQAAGSKSGATDGDWREVVALVTVKVGPRTVDMVELPEPAPGTGRHFRVAVKSAEPSAFLMWITDGETLGGGGIEVNPSGGVRYSYDEATSTLTINPRDPETAALVQNFEYRTDIGGSSIGSGNPKWSVVGDDIVFGPDANIDILGTLEYLVLRGAGNRILEFLEGVVPVTPVLFPEMVPLWDAATDVLTITSPRPIFTQVSQLVMRWYDYNEEEAVDDTLDASDFTVVSATVVQIPDASQRISTKAEVQIITARSAINVAHGRFQGAAYVGTLMAEVTGVEQTGVDEVTVTGVGFVNTILGSMDAISFQASEGLPQFFTPAGILNGNTQDPGTTVGALTDTSWVISHPSLAGNTLQDAFAEGSQWGSTQFDIDPDLTLD